MNDEPKRDPDLELSSYLRDRVGPEGPDYWQRIDDALDAEQRTAPVDVPNSSTSRNRFTLAAAVAAIVGLAVGAALLGNRDSQNVDIASPTTSSTVPAAPTSTLPADPDPTPDPAPLGPACDEPWPVFSAGGIDNEPLDTDGTPGPGVGSLGVEAGQDVVHWVGRFGTYEIRQPASAGLEKAEVLEPPVPTEAVAGYPASYHRISETRVGFLVTPDQPGCPPFSVEMYGENQRAIEEQAWAFATSLRPIGELDAYLAEVLPLFTPATGGADLEPGLCAERQVAADGVTEGAAQDFVRRFLTDRLAGNRAQDCLAGAGLEPYTAAEPSEFPLCLFACNGSSLKFGETQLMGERNADTIIVSVVAVHDQAITVRETLDVTRIDDGDGQRLVINHAVSGPVSWSVGIRPRVGCGNSSNFWLNGSTRTHRRTCSTRASPTTSQLRWQGQLATFTTPGR